MVLAALGATVWGLREPLRRDLPQRASLERGLLRRLEAWRVRRPVDPRPGAVLFGDSLLFCSGKRPIVSRLRERLDADGRVYDLLSLAHPGFRPIIAYYLLDEMLVARPALVVIELNLRVLGAPGTDPNLRFAGLSRRLSPRRALAVARALTADELGPMAPPLYRLEERLDLLDVADGVRERGRAALEAAGRWVNARLGTGDLEALRDVARGLQTRHDPATRLGALATYATSFATHPQAEVLRIVIEELRGVGARVLVYVSPVNLDYLASLGLSDEELALPERLEALRVAIGATSDEWLDLHASEGAEGFRDVWNHLHPPACDRVAARVATAIGAR